MYLDVHGYILLTPPLTSQLDGLYCHMTSGKQQVTGSSHPPTHFHSVKGRNGEDKEEMSPSLTHTLTAGWRHQSLSINPPAPHPLIISNIDIVYYPKQRGECTNFRMIHGGEFGLIWTSGDRNNSLLCLPWQDPLVLRAGFWSIKKKIWGTLTLKLGETDLTGWKWNWVTAVAGSDRMQHSWRDGWR